MAIRTSTDALSHLAEGQQKKKMHAAVQTREILITAQVSQTSLADQSKNSEDDGS